MFEKSTPRQCSPHQRDMAKHLIAWCLQRDPTRRPTMFDILTHPFITNERKTMPEMLGHHVFISQ